MNCPRQGHWPLAGKGLEADLAAAVRGSDFCVSPFLFVLHAGDGTQSPCMLGKRSTTELHPQHPRQGILKDVLNLLLSSSSLPLAHWLQVVWKTELGQDFSSIHLDQFLEEGWGSGQEYLGLRTCPREAAIILMKSFPSSLSPAFGRSYFPLFVTPWFLGSRSHFS